MSLGGLLDLPIELFLDQLLPLIDLPDLLALSKTCKFFAVLCSDDTFWKRKLREDLNYSITDARNKGILLSTLMNHHTRALNNTSYKASDCSTEGSAVHMYMCGGSCIEFPFLSFEFLLMYLPSSSESSHGRLGLATPRQYYNGYEKMNAAAGIPFPVELNLASGVRIVTIVAGGWHVLYLV